MVFDSLCMCCILNRTGRSLKRATCASLHPTVKDALEAMCVVIFGRTSPMLWTEVRSLLRGANPICSKLWDQEVALKVPSPVRQYIRQHFLMKAGFTPELLSRCSKPCLVCVIAPRLFLVLW